MPMPKNPPLLSARSGVTLVELMIAVAILCVGILGFVGAFRYITQSIHVSRTRTLATNLAQEKIETLKNLSYYELLLTTATAYDPNFTPSIPYDTANYGPETEQIGGITFTRYTYVTMAQMTNNVITTAASDYPDSGMKQIEVNVVWTDNGVEKKFTLNNLYENPNLAPLDASISGYVKDGSGNPIEGAYVRVEQNSDWAAQTDATGRYGFDVYHGTYTVRASSAGYFDGFTQTLDAYEGASLASPNTDMYLTAVGSGTIAGIAWINPDLVISQVVASTAQYGLNQNGQDFAGFQAQYVELYNPTTSEIDIATPGGSPLVTLDFQSAQHCTYYTDCTTPGTGIFVDYISTYVAPYHYYLFANTNTFVVNGQWVAADAVYDDAAGNDCGTHPSGNFWNTGVSPPLKMIIVPGHGGSVGVERVNGMGSGTYVDVVGFEDNGSAPTYYNGNYITFGTYNDFPLGQELVRISSPLPNLSLTDMAAYGHAYNSQNNANDFVYFPAINGVPFSPQNSRGAAFLPIAGVPAVGASVAASDGVSGSTQAYAAYIASGTLNLLYAPFTLPGVSTSPPAALCNGACWNVILSSGSYFAQISTVSVLQNQTTVIPGPYTVAGSTNGLESVILDSSTSNGFIRGQITDANAVPLNGVAIQVTGYVAGSQNTSANGCYFIETATGTVTEVINPNNASAPQYIQVVQSTTVSQGAITEADFELNKGGALEGYLTTGTTPLPNYVVEASIGGDQAGSGTSDTSGLFIIHNLSTGTYTVSPVLDSDQSSSPSSLSATVNPTSTVFIGTFTVSGALGAIAGSIMSNGASLTTGALIVASSGTISSTPPVIYGSSAPAMSPIIYSVSSKADGTYSLPVRGGYTYNLMVWVPTISGSNVTTQSKSYSGITVSPGQTTKENVTVP